MFKQMTSRGICKMLYSLFSRRRFSRLVWASAQAQLTYFWAAIRKNSQKRAWILVLSRNLSHSSRRCWTRQLGLFQDFSLKSAASTAASFELRPFCFRSQPIQAKFHRHWLRPHLRICFLFLPLSQTCFPTHLGWSCHSCFRQCGRK